MLMQEEREGRHPAGGATAENATPAAPRRRLFVSTSSPNPNGDIHLGHLAGPFLSANIYARYRRMQGDEVFFQSGTDDYQSWTVSMAEKMGMTPGAMAAQYGAMIAESCRMASIEVDQFQRPSLSPESAEIARDLLLRLHANGRLVEKEVAAPFCTACNQSLYDVFVKGGCPYCGAGSCGSGCETCGSLLDGFELVAPVCGRCGQPATIRTVRKLYFPLSAMRERLVEYYRTLTTNAFQRACWEKLLERGLPDFAATQFSDWGTPVPLPGFDGQCVSPWLQMTADHLASSVILDSRLGAERGGGGGWATFWKAENAEAAQFCGGDNSWLFGVLYPAIFMAYDPEIRPAAVLLPTQFYQLEGSIFSTSKRHAIWVRELVEKASADAARFYCARTCPEVEQTTFRMREFVEVVEGELRGSWEVWLRGLWAKIADECGGTAPEAPAEDEWRADQRRFQAWLGRCAEDARLAYDKGSFSPQRATRVLSELVRTARRFGRGEDYLRPVAAARVERRAALALELAAARALALLAQPVMPDFSAYLWGALGYGSPVTAQRWEDAPGLVPSGQRLGALADAYFPAVQSLLADA
jgi:methionyl-tRNA synthetase